MATSSEIQSLDEIQYGSRIQSFLLLIMLLGLFFLAFLNFFPISEKIKTAMNAKLKGTSCNPDFNNLRMEWFFPKIVVSDVSLPAGCFGRGGEPLKLSFLTLNWNIISFSPLGIPFRIDTELSGQQIAVHYVLGLNGQTIRLKDQSLNLEQLKPILGDKFQMGGKMVIDLNLQMSKNLIQNIELKAGSKNFQLPSQSVEGFTTPNLLLNDFYLEANTATHPRLNVDRLTLGDPDSPIRANFKGRIDLVDGNYAMSALNLNGEVAFSKNLVNQLPLIDMVFQAFPQKDGFYQIRIGGTVGAPKPSAP